MFSEATAACTNLISDCAQRSRMDTNPQKSEKWFMRESFFFFRFKCFGVKIYPNHITLKGILSQNSYINSCSTSHQADFMVINF